MVRLMQILVRLQREFILHGDAHLLPLTRAQLALELELHEFDGVARGKWKSGTIAQQPDNPAG